jgi:hypothetical protein
MVAAFLIKFMAGLIVFTEEVNHATWPIKEEPL